MKRIKIQFFLVATLLSAVVLSCRKNQDNNDSSEIAQQSSLAQKSINDLGTMTAEAIKGSFLSFSATCATITYDTTSTPKTITIDYGTSDCICADGKRRKGKLLITTNGVFNGFGDVNAITTTTNGYYVNDNLIEGTRTITRNTATTSKIISSATVTLPEERGSFTWKGNYVRTYISGDNTPYLNDDEYELTGEATGVNTKNIEYTVTVTEPLQIQLGCRWIKGGIATITSPSVKEEATLEYGDGSCDNTALLKYGKKEKTLTL